MAAEKKIDQVGQFELWQFGKCTRGFGNFYIMVAKGDGMARVAVELYVICGQGAEDRAQTVFGELTEAWKKATKF